MKYNSTQDLSGLKNQKKVLSLTSLTSEFEEAKAIAVEHFKGNVNMKSVDMVESLDEKSGREQKSSMEVQFTFHPKHETSGGTEDIDDETLVAISIPEESGSDFNFQSDHSKIENLTEKFKKEKQENFWYVMN